MPSCLFLSSSPGYRLVSSRVQASTRKGGSQKPADEPLQLPMSTASRWDSQYSFSLTTFRPSRKLVLIEYALIAVGSGQTSLGIKDAPEDAQYQGFEFQMLFN
ncbi:uncharacterized protein LOC133912614 isoform X3 [Phragmites australis]|uniref:uncharacterized protein LOC133912614 isoform X3 n=1 Tax=Phragmites australis TaxID=29695 RepID=UPI002D77E93C|nr:uncharacterized protein LOC133912614 isoform X3 [Phragmites australis]